METITLYISGMVCGGCASSVTKALQALPGVLEADVSHIEAKAEISFDPNLVKPDQLKSVVDAAGYKVIA